jgi:hypothetical protein
MALILTMNKKCCSTRAARTCIPWSSSARLTLQVGQACHILCAQFFLVVSHVYCGRNNVFEDLSARNRLSNKIAITSYNCNESKFFDSPKFRKRDRN